MCGNNKGLCFSAWLHLCVAALFYFSDSMENREITALFIGNSKCFSLRETDIEQAIIKAIESDIRVFLNGGQGQFDLMSAGVVHRLKVHYPHVKSYLILPYLTFNNYDSTLYDEIIYPFEEHIESYCTYMGNIGKRNRWMVNKASVAICYVRTTTGGAGKTLEYAKRKGLTIIDLNGGA